MMLQALGAMTPAEMLEVVNKAVHVAALGAKDKGQMEWRMSRGGAWRSSPRLSPR